MYLPITLNLLFNMQEINNIKTRYSDAELNEFKELIEQKLEAARKELNYLQEQIREISEDEGQNKSSDFDDWMTSSEREYLNQMASRQSQYTKNLENALLRIANKTYGICKVTGKLIEKERLKAVPHTTMSMEGKTIQK